MRQGCSRWKDKQITRNRQTVPEQRLSQTSTHKPDTLRAGFGGESGGGGMERPDCSGIQHPLPQNKGSRKESASVLLSPIFSRAMWSVENCIPEEYNGLPKVESKSIEAVHFSGPCAL